MNKSLEQQKGYALLVSVVVISTVLLILATVSARQTQNSFGVSESLSQEMQAQLVAEGCVQEALLRLAQDSTYTGNEMVSIQGGDCTIVSVSVNTIDVESVVQHSTYRIRVTLSGSSPPSIVHWERVAQF